MPPADTAIPTITVRAPKGGRRRAGRRWPEGESVVPVEQLSRDQLDAMAADPALIVTHGSRLVGEAQPGIEPPVGTMEREDLHAVRTPAAAAEIAATSVMTGTGEPAVVTAPAAGAVAPVPPSTIPGTQAAVSGAPNPDGGPTQADAADEAIEAAIRMLTPESYTSTGVPKIDAVRSMFGPAERDVITVEVRDRVWERMTAGGFTAPANSADEPQRRQGR